MHTGWCRPGTSFKPWAGHLAPSSLLRRYRCVSHGPDTPDTSAEWLRPAGLAIGEIITVFLFRLVGELLCVRVEDLEARLDSAVNSSPFCQTNSERW